MDIPIKNLVEALAEIFDMDEVEVLNILLSKNIGSWRDFLRLVSYTRREDKAWRVK